ncbi:outer membrane beta-barrel protein [Sphingorhabdus pulchriflava]|nr:outer membrane beta-barrel protein [Sphingorhabdus pulchriflava]
MPGRKSQAGSVRTCGRVAIPFKSSVTSIFDILSEISALTFDAFSSLKPQTVRAIRIKPLPGQVRTKPKQLGPIAVLLCTLVSRPAFAQSEEIVTPFDLFEPERGEGIRISPNLLFFPSIESDATYDDNVYNNSQSKLDDLVLSFRPRSTIRTDLQRHEFSLTSGADIRRYADIKGENSEQFDIQGKGRFDLAERTEVIVDAGLRRGIEQRGTAGDQFLTDEPVAFNRKFGGLRVRREGGFLELMAEGRIAETRYRDTKINGLPFDLSERDSTVTRARIRSSAPTSHYSRVFVEASINKVDYSNSLPTQRDSDGYGVLAGMLLRLTSLVNLEVGVGYMRQKFDNPSVKDVSDVNFHLQVEWTPRADWQITAAADRVIDPSFRLDAPAIVHSDFSLEARKALGDRTLVSAELGISDEKYQGSGRKDMRFHASARAHYRLIDNVGLVAGVGWRKQDGNALGRDYAGITVTLGVRARF